MDDNVVECVAHLVGHVLNLDLFAHNIILKNNYFHVKKTRVASKHDYFAENARNVSAQHYKVYAWAFTNKLYNVSFRQKLIRNYTFSFLTFYV